MVVKLSDQVNKRFPAVSLFSDLPLWTPNPEEPVDTKPEDVQEVVQEEAEDKDPEPRTRVLERHLDDLFRFGRFGFVSDGGRYSTVVLPSLHQLLFVFE